MVEIIGSVFLAATALAVVVLGVEIFNLFNGFPPDGMV